MQTVDRAFAVLRALSALSTTSSLADVTRATSLPKSTVLRLLSALEDQGMVESLGGRWALGPGLATLTHQASPLSSLKELARPHLVDLAERTEENASLAIADGDSALYIDIAVSESTVSVQDWTGERLPCHASAAGLALMSTWPEDRFDAYAECELTPFTDATVTTRSGLKRKMADLSEHGVVWTLREFSDDVNGVGAPIIGPHGDAIGAINIYGPDYRFPGDRPLHDICGPLSDACNMISAHLV